MTILVSANRTSHAFFFFIQKSFALKNKTEFSTQPPYFDISVFDDERNERIYGRFIPMTDSEVDNLIETDENAHTKKERFVQEIVVLIFQRHLQYTINRTFHARLWIRILIFSCSSRYFTCSLRSGKCEIST